VSCARQVRAWKITADSETVVVGGSKVELKQWNRRMKQQQGFAVLKTVILWDSRKELTVRKTVIWDNRNLLTAGQKNS